MWYEIFYNPVMKIWEVFKITQNGNEAELYKTLKTETSVKNFMKKNPEAIIK